MERDLCVRKNTPSGAKKKVCHRSLHFECRDPTKMHLRTSVYSPLSHHSPSPPQSLPEDHKKSPPQSDGMGTVENHQGGGAGGVGGRLKWRDVGWWTTYADIPPPGPRAITKVPAGRALYLPRGSGDRELPDSWPLPPQRGDSLRCRALYGYSSR